MNANDLKRTMGTVVLAAALSGVAATSLAQAQGRRGDGGSRSSTSGGSRGSSSSRSSSGSQTRSSGDSNRSARQSQDRSRDNSSWGRGNNSQSQNRDGRRDRERARDRDKDRYRDRDRHRGFDRDAYRYRYRTTRIYQSSNYGSYRYSYNAYDQGYRDGLFTGANDGYRGQIFEPERSHFYRHGAGGFVSIFGSRDSYTLAYRDGFLRGYEEGYQNYQNYFSGGSFRR